MFTCVLRRYMLLPQSYQYPNLSESADSVGGQLRGSKSVPLQWRNQFWQSSLEEGAESDAQSVSAIHTASGGRKTLSNTSETLPFERRLAARCARQCKQPI